MSDASWRTVRAVFLAVVVTCSVVAGGVGFAGSAGAAEGVSAAEDLTAAGDVAAQVDVSTSSLSGSGTESDPYIINNTSQLQAMEDDLDAHYQLGSDVDASNTSSWNGGSGFDPVGNDTNRFTGSLDGNGHTITGLTIDRPDERVVGVFGYSQGTVTNISFTSLSVTGEARIGGLVGENEGAVRDVVASGSVTLVGSLSDVGGLIGENVDGVIENTTTSVSVEGYTRVGGLVGENGGTIRGATATGSVTGDLRVGGLVGENEDFANDGTIRDSTASGSVNATGSGTAGGLVGTNKGGLIIESTVSGDVTSDGSYVGGLVGGNREGGRITDAAASGSVDASEGFVGGLVGNNEDGFVTNATASGSVTSGSDVAGGLVGSNINGTLRETFAVGSVTGSGIIGGLVGQNEDRFDNGTVTDSYWDTQTTGQSTSAGSAIGLTTSKMQGQAAKTNMTGLSFGTVWQTQPNDYPALLALNQPSARDDSFTTTENTTRTVSAPGVLGNDSDPNGDSLTATVVSGPTDGTVTLDPDGSFEYTPNRGFTGTDSFTYNASDGTFSDTGTVTITVSGSNGGGSQQVDVRPSDLDGTGTADDPYVITNASELQAMEDDLDAHYRLGEDIDASNTSSWNGGKGFDPIGGVDDIDNAPGSSFSGTFDGNGHTITGLTIARPNEEFTGLFGNTSSESVIREVTVTSLSVTGDGYVGGVIGRHNGGTVRNVSADGTVTGTGSTGGIIGRSGNDATISDVSASVTVTGTAFVGGVVGTTGKPITNVDPDEVDGSVITNASATGDVRGIKQNLSETLTNAQYVGGLVGFNNANGTIKTASASGDVNGTESGDSIGGLVGGNYGTIRNVSATGFTEGFLQTGGLVGLNDGPATIEKASASGGVTGATDIGGLAGSNRATLGNASASGAVTIVDLGTASSRTAGGLVGVNSGTIRDTFAVGSVSSEKSGVTMGGHIGQNYEGTIDNNGTVRDSYWDRQTTNQSVSAGSAKSLNTSQMTGEAARSKMSGLTYGEIWTIRPNDYPALIEDPEGPTAVGDAYTTPEDTTLTVSSPGVLGNDTDPDNDPLTVAVVSGPTNGTLTLDADGSFNYTPDADFAGADSFTYTVSDGTLSDTGTVTITVSQVNDAPTAVDDSYTTSENESLSVSAPGVLANDSDVDGDDLNATRATGPTNGSLSLAANGSFEYTPNPGFFGTDSFTYNATDGERNRTATVTIAVSEVNDPPTAVDDSYTTPEDSTLRVSAPGVLDNDSDPNDDVLNATRVSGPTDGSLTLDADGSFTYTPDSDFTGTDSFTYNATDGTLTDTTTVNINVTPIDDTAPVLTDASAVARDDRLTVVRDDDVVEVSVNVTDPGGGVITSVRVDASGFGAGTVNLSETNVEGVYGGTFTVNASQTRDSSEQLRITATDDAENTNSTRTRFALTLDTQPPVARVTANRTTVAPGETVRFNASGSTDDNFRGPDKHRWDFDSDDFIEARERFDRTDVVTHTYESTGTYTVELNISDSAGNTNTTSVTIDVGETNRAPTATDDAYLTTDNSTLGVSGSGVLGNDSDPDGDALNAARVTGPTNGSLTLDADGSFTYTPEDGFTGTDSFTYNATDGSLNDTATVTITVGEASDQSANYSVRITDVNASVVAGEDVVVEYEVTNTGGQAGTQDIALDVNTTGETVPNVSGLTLNAGETFSGRFSYTTSESDTPAVSVSVGSENDSDTRTVEVLDPAAFEVQIGGTNGPVVAGADASVEYTVQNTGGVRATKEVEIFVNGTSETVRDLTLGPGESTSNTFSYSTAGADTPAISVNVESDDDSETRTIAVADSPAFDVRITGTNGPVSPGEDVLVEYVVENTGSVEAAQDVEIAVNGTPSETASVRLGPESSTSRQFTYSTSDADTPGVSVSVETNDSSDSRGITVAGSSTFEVAIQVSNGPVPPEGDVRVDYVVRNTGSVEGTQDIEFLVNGSQEDIAGGLTLGPGGNTSGTFNYSTTEQDSPAVSLSVRSDNDTATGVVAVAERTAFDVAITSVPTSAATDEEVRIAYEVTNTGDSQDTQDIEVRVNGTKEDTVSDLTLDAGETSVNTVNYSTTTGDPPAISVSVNSSNDTATALIQVQEAEPDPAASVSTPLEEPVQYDPTQEFEFTTIHDASGVIAAGDVAIRVRNATNGNGTEVAFNASKPVSGETNTTVPADALSGDVALRAELVNNSTGRVETSVELFLATGADRPGDIGGGGGAEPAPSITALFNESDEPIRYSPDRDFEFGTSHNATGIIAPEDVAIRLVNNTSGAVIGNSTSKPVSGTTTTTIPAGALSGDVSVRAELVNSSAASEPPVAVTRPVSLTAAEPSEPPEGGGGPGGGIALPASPGVTLTTNDLAADTLSSLDVTFNVSEEAVDAADVELRAYNASGDRELVGKTTQVGKASGLSAVVVPANELGGGAFTAEVQVVDNSSGSATVLANTSKRVFAYEGVSTSVGAQTIGNQEGEGVEVTYDLGNVPPENATVQVAETTINSGLGTRSVAVNDPSGTVTVEVNASELNRNATFQAFVRDERRGRQVQSSISHGAVGFAGSPVSTIDDASVSYANGTDITGVEVNASFDYRFDAVDWYLHPDGQPGTREIGDVQGIDSDTRLRVNVTVSNFDPLFVVGAANATDWYTTRLDGNATRITFAVTPAAADWNERVTNPDPGEWPLVNGSATVSYDAIVEMKTFSLEGQQTGRERLRGGLVASDAQAFAPPRYTPPSNGEPGSLDITVASPHYEPDGTTPSTGFYRAIIPDTIVADWGIEPSQLTATYQGRRAPLTAERLPDGGVRVFAPIEYSSGTVSVTGNTSAPQVSAVEATNPAGRELNVTIDVDRQLDEIGVSITGPESAELSEADFEGTQAGDGTYTYTASYAASTDGTYSVTLDRAADTDGSEIAAAVEDSVTVTAGAGSGGDRLNGTIAVDARNGTDDGSAPFATVGAALDAAAPGATVNVGSGTYDGFTVTTERVAVVGRDNGTVVEGAVHLAAVDTELRNIRVAPPAFDADSEGGAGQAVLVTGSEATVDGNTVIVEADPIAGGGNGSVSVRGVQVAGSGGGSVEGVVVSDNRIRGATTRGPGTASVVGVLDRGNTTRTRVIDNNITVTSDDEAIGVVTRAGGVAGAAPTTELLFNDITAVGDSGSDSVGYRVRSTENAQVNVERQLIKYNSFEGIGRVQHWAATGRLDLTVNRWEDPGGVAFVSDSAGGPIRNGGAVVFDPVLTEEKAAANDDDLLAETGGQTVATTTDYGSYVEIETDGEPTVVGFPAPPAAPLSELLSNDTIRREDGEAVSIFVYDNTDRSFDPVTGDYVPEVGDVLVLTTEGSTELSEEFVVPIDTEPDSVAGSPSEIELREGWNLVATGAAEGPEDPTVAGAEVVVGGQFQTQPRQPGAPAAEVGAYDGTWLFVDGDGQLFTGFVEDQPPGVYFNRTLDVDGGSGG